MKSDSEIKREIGAKLRKLRKEKAGYSSHEDFALDKKLARVQYFRFERGQNNFTIDSLLELLHIHQISLEEFFSGMSEIPDLPMKIRRKREKE